MIALGFGFNSNLSILMLQNLCNLQCIKRSTAKEFYTYGNI